MNDDLGKRMKERYEDRSRTMLPRRTYTILRVDGKAFHSFTRHLVRDHFETYSTKVASAMDDVGLALCRDAQGARLAFVQSDEVSVLTTDFDAERTEAWFDGNLQKIASVGASIATMAFNCRWTTMGAVSARATFDGRAFVIPDPVEVENYFIWRQKDAERNSLSMLAQSKFSAKQLHGVDAMGMHEMLHEVGLNWNDVGDGFKRGRLVAKIDGVWTVEPAPIFTRDRAFLTALVPRQWAGKTEATLTG